MTKITEEEYVPMPAPLPEQVIASTAEAFAVSGPSASGKSTFLVNRVSALLADGAEPGDIVVFCASPDAVQSMRGMLHAKGEQAGRVCAITPREFALRLLGNERVSANVGRKARLLAPFEFDFLLEDVKVTGVNPKRLREMLKFLYKGMSQLSDWESDWLVTTEEEMVFSALKESLGFTGGVIEPELSNLVTRCLREDSRLCGQFVISHVLVDDYQLLSRASQALVNLIAGQSIAISYDARLCVQVFESYPYAAGVEEFLSANAYAEQVALESRYACAASATACDALIGAQDGKDGEGSQMPFVLQAPNPSAELSRVVSFVRESLASGVAPADICVAAPHSLWARNVARALHEQGIRADVARDARVLSGDIRKIDSCARSRAYTALLLLADASDDVAWRSWLGFGDWLCNSTAMAKLRAWAFERGYSLHEALRALDASEMASVCQSDSAVSRIAQAETSMEELRVLVRGAHGTDLLRVICDFVAVGDSDLPAFLGKLTAPFEDGRCDGDDAVALAKRARMRLAFPSCSLNGTVVVASLERAAALSAACVVVCGFDNGLFPLRACLDRSEMTQVDAEKRQTRDRALLAKVVGSACRALAFSWFETIELEPAEMLQLKMRRIELRNGVRTALAEPSVYLESIERACGASACV